ncbi:Protein kinase domain [Dillenia turbinata]|uniref:non-specific serine/threonine protein kinase n=1 Tax=Dillenia turbinata TaxID=194707 RepID=A0AAN8ZAP3_9MAGN
MHRRRRNGELVRETTRVWPKYKLTCFCYNDLKAATERFSVRNFIGEGGMGKVYKGWIDNHTMAPSKRGTGLAVAVKELRKENFWGHDEWQNELKFLSRFNHPNVVKLIGYCSEGDNRILVYEYMRKGSLEAHLNRESKRELDWKRRIRIAVGAARGLAYLHGASRPVIHRDLKASNILLDIDYTPKISDFGLAKFAPDCGKSHITTRILGTKGYFAPEYVATGHLTLKCDVYGFGVVLLQLFSGSPVIKKYSDGIAGDLAQWAKPYLCSRVEIQHVIDKKLATEYPVEDAYEFASIIGQCLDLNPRSRPTMREVVSALEKLDQHINSSSHNSITV